MTGFLQSYSEEKNSIELWITNDKLHFNLQTFVVQGAAEGPDVVLSASRSHR